MSFPPVRKAVIPVAGLGTRFLPATKAIPKELLPLVHKPVIQHIVEEAVSSGIEEIIFVTSEKKHSIEVHFDRDHELEMALEQKGKEAVAEMLREISHSARFVFVPQMEPLGLGHAVLQARDVVGDEPFIVMSGDDVIDSEIPATRQMIDVYAQHGGSVLGVMEVEDAAVDRYGIIDPDEELSDGVYHVKDVIEKPALADAPSRLGAGGRWLLSPDIFRVLEHQEPGAGNEIQLTDAIRTLISEGRVYACRYNGDYRDCGNKLEYVKAVVSMSLKDEELGDDLRAFLQTLEH